MVFRRHLHFNPYLLPSFPSWVRCFSPQKRSLLQFGELHGRNTRSFSALGLEAWFAPGWKRKMVAMLGGKCRLAKVFGFKWSTVTPSTFLYFSHQIKGECDISSVLSLHAILSQDFSNVWAGRIQCLVNLMQHIPKMVVGRQVGQGSDGTWNSKCSISASDNLLLSVQMLM